MTWKLYKYDGHYIQGQLVSKHTTLNAALKKAKKEIGHVREVEQVNESEELIWLDADDGTPVSYTHLTLQTILLV